MSFVRQHRDPQVDVGYQLPDRQNRSIVSRCRRYRLLRAGTWAQRVRGAGFVLRQNRLIPELLAQGGCMSAQRTILLATSRIKALDEFIEALTADGQTNVIPAGNAAEALDLAVRTVPSLAVVDQDMGEDSGLALVRELLHVNAFIYTAVISDMDEAAFHERSEGLGILTRLPVEPKGQDARQLLSLLKSVAPL
jgi:CheY-like chemotaxis protein